MKKSFFVLVLAALSFFSCRRNAETGGEVRFRLGVTRSFVPVTLSSLASTGFNALAMLDDRCYIPCSHLSYRSEDGCFHYEPSWYYPLEGFLDFYAVLPGDVILQDSRPCVVFSQEEAAYACDLVAGHASASAGAASLSLRHKLSRLNLVILAERDDVDFFVRRLAVTSSVAATYDFLDDAWCDATVGTRVLCDSPEGIRAAIGGTSLGDDMSLVPGQVIVDVSWETRHTVTGEVVETYERSVPLVLAAGRSTTLRLTATDDNACPLSISVTVGDWPAWSGEDVVLD